MFRTMAGTLLIETLIIMKIQRQLIKEVQDAQHQKVLDLVFPQNEERPH